MATSAAGGPDGPEDNAEDLVYSDEKIARMECARRQGLERDGATWLCFRQEGAWIVRRYSTEHLAELDANQPKASIGDRIVDGVLEMLNPLNWF